MKAPLWRFAVATVSFCICLCLPRAAWSATSAPQSNGSDAAQSSEAATSPSSPSSPSVVTIPGPLRSFLRMAAISQKGSVDEVLPLLARNVAMQGYHQESKDKGGRPTEFLILLMRYLQQARELQMLAHPQGIIRVSDCDEAATLLQVLGYRLRQGCGPKAALETSDTERAFLTIDSGFPLADLEEALRGGEPFEYAYASTEVPVLFAQSDWTNLDRNNKNAKRKDGVVDSLLHDPVLARLYWAMARIDAETRMGLRQSPGLRKLTPFASVLDFYGSQICVRSGRVVVPGGSPAESAWKDLVGASPESPGEFVTHLLAKDGGWLAAYFDAMSRVNQNQQTYFTEPHHLKRFYEALRGQDITPSPARPVFRPDPGLLLLMARLQFEPDGQPHIPGGLEVWKEQLRRKSDSKVVRDWGRRASHWNNPEQLVEGMFALSRVSAEDGPEQIFLTLNEVDRARSPEQRLSPQTVRLLASKFSRFSHQYMIFSEFPPLNNGSITRFLSVAEALDRMPDRALRANALGILQANVGLWQILARQGQISTAGLNDSWRRVINPFAGTLSSVQLFDSGRASLRELLRSATGKPELSQDQFIALLAGPSQASKEGQQVRQELANRIRSVLTAQRLVSLDTLFALGDGLNQMAQGKPIADTLTPLAAELRDFEMPRPIFTNSERNEWASPSYYNPHTALQTRTDLGKVIKSAGSPKELADARGLLAPFLRDTLVGLNYAYYEPPGAQVLHNSPLFVRSHDFSGSMTLSGEQAWQTPRVFGTGATASGGAHLVGSLAGLPYVLAEAEQDLVVPENVQALIWQEVVPGLMTSAVLPRWWGVTRNELHAVTLYQRAGEELLAAAAANETLRQTVMNILADRMVPRRLERLENALVAGRSQEMLADMMPAETFYLAAEFRRRFPGTTDYWGTAGKDLEDLVRRYPAEVSWERLSEDFGVPHPALEQSYGRELLNVKPFPAFMGYYNRLLAESWDSNNLYWGRLADEMGYSPVMLNRLVPELTHRMAEKIFATDLEDWPALLRAMREAGEEFRRGKIAALPKPDVTSEP
jgi:hypothetical protein